MINFDKLGGLVPAIVQDFETKDVLMLGFMNDEAWRLTVSTGRVWYYSRKRARLWMKGEQSGHHQIVKRISLDCDNDTLLIQVQQIGGACDLGFRTCFDKDFNLDRFQTMAQRVFDPSRVYDRYDERLMIAVPRGSLAQTTASLLSKALSVATLEGDEFADALLPIHGSDVGFRAVDAREIPDRIAAGEFDAGITGFDWVVETQAPVIPLARLGYNKAGRGSVIWSIAVHEESKLHSLQDLGGATIVTELRSVTEQFLSKRDVTASVIPASQIGDRFRTGLPLVELIESGATLRRSHYIPLCPVLETEAVLVANRESYAYTWKRRRLEELAVLLLDASAKLPRNPKALFSFAPATARPLIDWETHRLGALRSIITKPTPDTDSGDR